MSATPVRRVHRMPFGAEVRDDGGVRFRLWAPAERRIALVLEDRGERLAMEPRDGGWHELVTDRAAPGSRYRFELERGLRVPDPASRFQPDDVHGPSEVIDPASYAWADGAWRGRPWHEAVVYELHVGAFTPQGTFLAAAEKLDHLVRLGVTSIELMPIADFPGERSWGYDGVLPFAPDASYGRPEHLKALVDAAHARNVMVLLDVVYNHFGPDGNYLPLYAPQVFTDRHETPWGNALNFDGPGSRPVRELVIENALYWLEELHLDGLRLDAVDAILDDSRPHVLEELAARARVLAGDRHVHLILENANNEARWLERDAANRPRHYTAQWNDDVHHGLHTAATGERGGYYAEYCGDTSKLARALAEGFAFQGEPMAYLGRERGEPSAHLPPTAFVAFLQNHDQIGNRACGDRLCGGAPPETVRAVAAAYLLAPQIPLLFMGEEWAAPEPFPFFCDFDEPLATAVRDGRRNEFAGFPEFADERARERIPDPTAEATFRSAKLDWAKRDAEPHASWLDWYRRILAVRRAEIVPRLADVRGGPGEYRVHGDGVFAVRWRLGDDAVLGLHANLGPRRFAGPFDLGRAPRRILWREGGEDGAGLAPWSVVWWLEEF
ncbi:MAG TPA: malto-oligosyltrehalose trehalohydrolase [Gammaproteobacteria bacterium]